MEKINTKEYFKIIFDKNNSQECFIKNKSTLNSITFLNQQSNKQRLLNFNENQEVNILINIIDNTYFDFSNISFSKEQNNMILKKIDKLPFYIKLFFIYKIYYINKNVYNLFLQIFENSISNNVNEKDFYDLITYLYTLNYDFDVIKSIILKMLKKINKEFLKKYILTEKERIIKLYYSNNTNKFLSLIEKTLIELEIEEEEKDIKKYLELVEIEKQTKRKNKI